MSIFFTAYIQSDFFGKGIFLSLFFSSLICCLILIYKLMHIRIASLQAQPFQQIIEKNKQQLLHIQQERLLVAAPPSLWGRWMGSFFIKKDFQQPFYQLFVSLKEKAIEILNKNHFFLKEKGQEGVYLSARDFEALETYGLTTISEQSKQLSNYLFILSTIVTLAPFLGLLGTVWGILETFSQLQTGGSVGSNSLVLGGLATALATTVLGLVIAIPALIAFNYLKHRVASLTADMENFLYKMLSQLELQYRKIDS
jgi:biopolymer transport protein TolQ